MMREIDLDAWPRKDHYLFFKEFDFPYFSIAANVDLTTFLPLIKEQKISFTAAIMYLVARCANAIPEFKQRVREGNPIEHDQVHPSTTILSKNDLFTFCTVEYQEDFHKFTQAAEEEIALVKGQPYLEEKYSDDRMLFMTSIPWISFTSFMHPIKLSPPDSVPRFSWGKYFQEGEKVLMPFSIMGHHALMDGLHAGKFFEKLQGLLNNPSYL
jgi:chloramphenicol O-acetyltransferase type A